MGPLIIRTFLLGFICFILAAFLLFLLRGHREKHPKIGLVVISIFGFVFCALMFIMYLEGQ